MDIKSPLSGGLFVGTDYWLDNTIFNMETVLAFTTRFAFGNTITYYSDPGAVVAEFNSNLFALNTIVQNQFVMNSFGDFTGNTIIQTTQSQFGIQSNVVGGCGGNTFSEFYQNNAAGIDSNDCVTMASNTGSYIENNTCPRITNNSTNNITYNTNTNQIDGNVCDVIDANGSNVTEISGNIATEIGNCNNVGGIIYNNFVNALTNVTGTGSVDSNSGNLFNNINLNGDIKSSFNIFFDTVTITNVVDNTIFNGKIVNKTINPTANMISGNSSILKYDYGFGEFVEESISFGSATYSGAITF